VSVRQYATRLTVVIKTNINECILVTLITFEVLRMFWVGGRMVVSNKKCLVMREYLEQQCTVPTAAILYANSSTRWRIIGARKAYRHPINWKTKHYGIVYDDTLSQQSLVDLIKKKPEIIVTTQFPFGAIASLLLWSTSMVSSQVINE